MYYSDQKKQIIVQNRRTFFLFLGKLSVFSVIGWRLFNIQILDSAKYRTLSKNNQINIEILYPVRGEIKDRNGNIIATNKKVYDLYVIPEQTENLNETLNNLNNFIHFDFEKKRKIILLSKKVKKFESIKIEENLNWEKLELIEANKNHLPGLHLQEDYQRIYPQHKYFSHILGYISQPTPNDLNLPFISKMPRLDIGKTGLEKFLNEYLVGKAGNKEIEVNSSGKVIREISLSPSTKGQNISISIDQRLQKYSCFELEKHKAGSIVVLNIKTGEILSMASMPAFDPNLIIKKPNNNYWQSLLNHPLSPLTNRSIQGLYSPGSTFKMIVALAGLKHKVINQSKTQFCDGKIEFGTAFFNALENKLVDYVASVYGETLSSLHWLFTDKITSKLLTQAENCSPHGHSSDKTEDAIRLCLNSSDQGASMKSILSWFGIKKFAQLTVNTILNHFGYQLRKFHR